MPKAEVQAQNQITRVKAQSLVSIGNVTATADTTQYWSQKSREWATSGELVDNEDYSSKYYAKKSKEASDIATTAKNDIEVSKTEFDNTYNEYTQNLTTQETQAIQNITTKETESIANIETSAQTEIGKINTAGQTQVNNINITGYTQITDIQNTADTKITEIQTEGAAQVNNIKQTGSEWGKIQGNITNQTDLQEKLALKTDKAHAAHAAMPSNRYVDLIPVSGKTYVAPADGMFTANLGAPNNDVHYLVLAKLKGTTFTNWGDILYAVDISNTAPLGLGGSIPIKKGDTVYLEFNFAFSSDPGSYLRFIYAEGAE